MSPLDACLYFLLIFTPTCSKILLRNPKLNYPHLLIIFLNYQQNNMDTLVSYMIYINNIVQYLPNENDQ